MSKKKRRALRHGKVSVTVNGETVGKLTMPEPKYQTVVEENATIYLNGKPVRVGRMDLTIPLGPVPVVAMEEDVPWK